MNRSIPVAIGVLASLLISASVFGGGDLSQQQPLTVRVDLGKDGTEEHKFHPDQLTFETGKLYKLVIHNPSNSKHYFTSVGLAQKIYTRKVQVMDDIGQGAKTIAAILEGVRARGGPRRGSARHAERSP